MCVPLLLSLSLHLLTLPVPALLKECDVLRDETLIELGVRMEDKEGWFPWQCYVDHISDMYVCRGHCPQACWQRGSSEGEGTSQTGLLVYIPTRSMSLVNC